MISFILGMIIGAMFGVASMCVLVVGDRGLDDASDLPDWAFDLSDDGEVDA